MTGSRCKLNSVDPEIWLADVLDRIITGNVAHEQRILPRQGHRFHRTLDNDRTLDNVGVHFDPAIFGW
jgi:hypothetical protein